MQQRRHAKRTPYEVLDIAPDATEDEIKRSFRRLALKLHPDKQTGSDEERMLAERHFKEVNEAYSVLSDPVRRERYDLTGNLDDEDLDNGPSTGGSRQRGGGSYGSSDPGLYMSVDELMSLTFGTRRRRYTMLSDEPLLLLLLLNLPALLLLFTSVTTPSASLPSYADATAAPFRLQADATYAHERRTAGAAVSYFLRADAAVFVGSSPHALELVEAAVESLDRERQRSACDGQLRQRQLSINEARRMPKGPEREERVRVTEGRATPACDLLQAKYREVRSASEAFKTRVQEGMSTAGHVWRAKTTAERAASAGSVRWAGTSAAEDAIPVVRPRPANLAGGAGGSAAGAA